MMLPLLGATAMQPIARVCCVSVSGFHVVPPSVVFQTPPPAEAIYKVLAFNGSAATPAIRPLSIWPNSFNAAGPMAVQLVVVSAGATLPPIPMLPSLATAVGSQGVTWKGGFGGACAISCSTAPLKINEAKAKAAVLRNHGMITSSVVRLDVLVLSSSPAS